jgi:hypothetical protein
MQRRDFLGAVSLAGAAALAAVPETARAADAAPAGKKQFLELRTYKVADAAMRGRLETFLKDAAIPAWNRLGVKPVGVFANQDEKVLDLFVLLPYDSIEILATAAGRLAADAEYQKAGAAFLDAPKDSLTYSRIESRLMLAFDQCPKVEVPSKKDTRVFQLRIYESFSDQKAAKKIEMFNTGGEMALFRKVGMPPVFFGQSLVGTKLPDLAYMLGFDDPDAQKAGWKKFTDAPEWDKLKNDTQYKDTVTDITNIVLKPAACSQV